MAPVSTLSFQCVLVTGGAGGLGKAMAAELVKRGKKVILAGRTEKTLAATIEEIGAAAYYVLDTGDVASIEPFIARITKEHPELDAVINNAGVQRPLQVLGPDYGFDLASADQELDINIRGPLHLSVGLIQKHFQHLPSGNGGVVMNVSSALGFVPFSVINPVYNGTKAWLHFFTTNLRTQLQRADSKIKVVEIVPPQVESDLHRDRTDPDDNKKHNSPTALSIDEFMSDVIKGWENDADTIGAGPSIGIIEEWQKSMGAKYDKMAK